MFSILLAYYIAFFALTFVWPVWRFWRREGITPLALANDDSLHGDVALWFRAWIMAIFLLVGALAAGLSPSLLGQLNWFKTNILEWVGIAALAISMPIIAIAQIQMGRSWRIGIDQKRQTAIVDKGIFAHSRNPIFIGIRINLLGLFLIVPTGVTLAIWLLSELLMSVQVRLEEAHLRAIVGADYETYCRNTRRWI